MGAGGGLPVSPVVLPRARPREPGVRDSSGALGGGGGDMPIVGPNCYGFLNYLDNVTLWPDQHGGIPLVALRVAIVGQSSNMAINMTMQRRRLPIALLTAGTRRRRRSRSRPRRDRRIQRPREVLDDVLTANRVGQVGCCFALCRALGIIDQRNIVAPGAQEFCTLPAIGCTSAFKGWKPCASSSRPIALPFPMASPYAVFAAFCFSIPNASPP